MRALGPTGAAQPVPETALSPGGRGQGGAPARWLSTLITGALNRAVKRNIDRFPADLMFQLTDEEAQSLRCQTGILNNRGDRTRGSHRKYPPYAFTEQGVAMLSSVLRSARAAHVNIGIMRAFVRLREMLQQNADLAKKLAAHEKKCDARYKVVFDPIRDLTAPAPKPTRRIGFRNG
jgi:hypothetical protein